MLDVKHPPANVGDVRDAGSIPGLGRSPRGGHGNPLQYSWASLVAGFQPRLIQGIRSGDGVGEDQDTIASIRY